ncbi:ABC-F family ATP-binding cassette domain-containing protein [Paeniglutamicibacter cryotolerans]|uniref:Macrolide transport system ATP-binding/permease protein n=1 Tax=Paeniglutamicibacter cryotolerans TaxID=670079 RepID=A0A839QDM0_9MICC|nr:ABC-F family ATP-binding cassette domain-containing protein [Paeniglutamicibacter cryotolerans]MBB2994000.1 macrolide transport system ATP-binding/permease protein [Paeniglutamicibacter cryotolerans]
MAPALSVAAHLRVDGISHSFADRRVLTGISFTLPGGERAGLIGENGSGKSTLLRIIAGLASADAGSVSAVLPGGRAARIGLLHQEPPFSPDDTVLQALESAVAPVRAAAAALEQSAAAMAASPGDVAASDAFSAALELTERLGTWDIDSHISSMCSGFGLSDLDLEGTTGALSGGQLSRLSLLWVLLSAPDVLLLDEPTNHLDDAATAHLRTVLAAWPGPVLIASHDRSFLDDSLTSLIDLDPSPMPQAFARSLVGDGDGSGIGTTRFSGSYTGYLQARLDSREHWERRYTDEQAELKRLRASVRENQGVGHANWKPRSEVRAMAKFSSDRNAKVVSRRVNDSRSRLDELQAQQIRKPPRELCFSGLNAAGSTAGSGRSFSGPVLAAAAVAVDGRLPASSLSVAAGEKWLITGPHGSGKSTLLDLLAGRLAPDAGSVNAPASLRIGLLAQDVELPDPRERGPGRTVLRAYTDLVGERLASEVPLRLFGLVAGRDENRPVATLSVGQQRRLALAILLADPPDVLLLDEPTNHLSLVLATMLEAAIPDYPGAVVVASHDRWLRRGWTGRRLELSDAAGGR